MDKVDAVDAVDTMVTVVTVVTAGTVDTTNDRQTMDDRQTCIRLTDSPALGATAGQAPQCSMQFSAP